MRKIIGVCSNNISFLWANLGHCPSCTRKAFLAAITGWGIVLLAAALTRQSHFLLVTAVFAVGLTALWLMHLLAFANKIFAASYNTASPRLERRTILLMFAQTFTFAALVSAAPRLAQATSPKEYKDYSVDLQQKLQQTGYYHGKIDGLMGPQTYDAIKSYKQAHGLGDSNSITADFQNALGLPNKFLCAPGQCYCGPFLNCIPGCCPCACPHSFPCQC
jgi:hypothetical protein